MSDGRGKALLPTVTPYPISTHHVAVVRFYQRQVYTCVSHRDTCMARNCAATTADGEPCSNTATEGSQTCHIDAHVVNDGDESDDAPTLEALFRANTGFMASLVGVDDAWQGKTRETTVAATAIRQVADDGDEKKALYRRVFGTCDIDGCDNGCNGFEPNTCHDCDRDESDESDDGDTMTVTIDGREVTGDKETVLELLDES